MAFIGLILALSISGLTIGLLGIIFTCPIGIWHKIALVSVAIFVIFSVLAVCESNKDNKNIEG